MPSSTRHVTRLSHGIHKPKPKYQNDDYCFFTQNIPSEQKAVTSALKHPGWTAAMKDELMALSRNHT